uniref:Element PBSX protein xkdH n=1 Tax=Dulem virus 37 TaxID=3145755 RepID=A0AAU8AZW8_9CAUD
MSFESMLNHKCDVYHIQKSEASPGYGLAASPAFSYPDEPDIADLQCHFGVKSGTRLVVQLTPQAEYQAKIKLVVPLGTDIRLNDKIVDKQTGYEYTADIPVQVRSHHLFVMLSRKSAQEPL